MIRQTFSSEKSKDCLEINYFSKSHKTNLNILIVDNMASHIELLGELLIFLKNNSIQWVCVDIVGDPEYPENTVSFVHEKTGKICCHVEGFENFYLKNLLKMIKINNIYFDKDTNQVGDGWTKVTNKNKQKEDKFNNIKQEINALIGNWNDLA